MDGSINGNERTVAGVTARDQRALVLIDALGARLVEAIKAGVNATTEGLGVIADETERLDQRLAALADLLENQAPVEATVDLTPILEMLAELRDVVASRNGEAPVRSLDLATRDHVQAEGSALAARLDGLEMSVRSELADFADRVTGIIGAVETGHPVDLSPVLAQLAAREGDSGLDAAVAVTLERMDDHLAALRAAVDSRPEPDLRPVVSDTLDEVRSIVDERIAALHAALPGQPDLAPVVNAVSSRLAELRGSLQGRIDEVQASVAAGPDLTPVTSGLEAAVATLTARLDRIEAAIAEGPDLSPIAESVASSVAEVRDVLAARVDDVQQTLAGRADEIQNAIAGRADEIQNAIAGRADEIQQTVASRAENVQQTVAGRADEIQQTIARRTDEVHQTIVGRADQLQSTIAGRADEIHAAVASRADELQQTVVYRAGEIQSTISGRADDLARAVAMGTELAGVRHDAMTTSLASLEEQLRASVAAGDVIDAVHAVRGAVDAIAERLDAARGQSADDTRAVQQAVLEAVDALAADVASVRERAIAAADTNARARQDLEESLASIGEQTAARIDGLRDVFSHGTDLTPFLDSVAGIGQQVADVRAAVEHHAPGAAILELLRTIGDLRGVITGGHDHIAAEVAAARSSVENWLAQLDGTVSHVAGTQAEDMAGLVELAEQVRELGNTAADRSADAAQRLAAIEANLAAADGRHAEDAGRLVAIHEATAATVEHASAIAGWTQAQQFEQWLAGVERSINDKVAEIARAVPGVHDAVENLDTTVRRSGDATVASLDGLRSHLAASGGFTGQLERFRALQAAIDGLAAEVARSTSSELAPFIALSIDDATTRAAARLEDATSSALTRFARRDEEVLRRATDLEVSLARSIETIEVEVREVIAGLSGNDRLVRSRFAEVETTLQSLRGEVAHVRTLRSAIDALTASLDTLRHQARLASAVPVTTGNGTGGNGAAVAAAAD